MAAVNDGVPPVTVQAARTKAARDGTVSNAAPGAVNVANVSAALAVIHVELFCDHCNDTLSVGLDPVTAVTETWQDTSPPTLPTG
jgi:hypothetical protein